MEVPHMITVVLSAAGGGPGWKELLSATLASSHSQSKALSSLELHQKEKRTKPQQHEKESGQLQPGPLQIKSKQGALLEISFSDLHKSRPQPPDHLSIQGSEG